MLDMQSLLQPVSDTTPGGQNLEYSAEYSALTKTLQGKPERRMGEAVVAAEPPDWSTAIDQASALLRSSKDLRIATDLTRALLKRDGYAGLAQGLALMRGLVETFWSVLHPVLEEEDHDPTSRINAMAALTHREMVSAVRAAPLVKSRAAGAISLKDVEAAARSRDGSAGAPPSWDSVLQAVALPELTEATGYVDACERAARELEVAWKMQLDSVGHGGSNGGGTRADDFTELRQVLLQASRFMKERLEARQKADVPAAADGAPAPTPSGANAPRHVAGELRSREDVVAALESVCAYYARHEPSSPVPLLIERCKRLVAMSFIDIVKDMIPDGVHTIETIAGKASE